MHALQELLALLLQQSPKASSPPCAMLRGGNPQLLCLLHKRSQVLNGEGADNGEPGGQKLRPPAMRCLGRSLECLGALPEDPSLPAPEDLGELQPSSHRVPHRLHMPQATQHHKKDALEDPQEVVGAERLQTALNA